MQNKLVIAALLGAASARDFMSLKNSVVKSIQKDFKPQILDIQHAINQSIDNAQDAISDAEDKIDNLNQSADDFFDDLKEEINSDFEHALTPQRSAIDKEKLVQIVEGILKGALDAEGFEDIASCIGDAEHVFKDAEDAFKDFESKDVTKVIDGIKKVADLLENVKTGMSDCASLKADWNKLEKMIMIFRSPSSFAYHVGKDLLVNGVDIFGEVKDSVVQYKKKNWIKFGVDIGKAAAKTIFGQESLEQLGADPEKIKLAQIQQGILQAFGGKFDILALLECIDDEDKALLMFDVAVQSFEGAVKDKDPQDAIAGVIATIAGIQQLKAGLPECEAIDTSTFNYKQFESTYDIAAHPTQHFKIIDDDLHMNGVSIKKDIVIALKSYKKGEFAYFGFFIGNILELATRPVQDKVLLDREIVYNMNMVAEVAQGLLESTKVGTFNYTNLLTCIYETDQSALILYKAVTTLEESYKDKDPKEAVVGFIETVAFLAQLKQSLPVCEAIDQKDMDWANFNNIVDVVESPEKHMQVIGEDIFFNEVIITEELSKSLDSFRSGNFKDFGYQFGDALSLATETPESLYLY